MMKVADRFRRTAAQGFLALAALVFVVRAFIPGGFMLDRDPASGAFEITICTGLSTAPHPALPPAEAARLADFYHKGEAPPAGESQACPFAVALADAPAAPGFVLQALPILAATAEFLVSAQALSRFEARPPLPPRGPPNLL